MLQGDQYDKHVILLLSKRSWLISSLGLFRFLEPGMVSLDERFGQGGIEQSGVDEESTDDVGIDIGSWASIFNVSGSICLGGGGWDTE